MFLPPARLAALAGLAGLGVSVAQTMHPREPVPAAADEDEVWLQPITDGGACQPDGQRSGPIPMLADRCLLKYDFATIHVSALPRCPDGRAAQLAVYGGERCNGLLRVYGGPGEAPWSAPGCTAEAPGAVHSVALLCPAAGAEVTGDEFRHLWDRVFPGDDWAPPSLTPPAPTATTAVATAQDTATTTTTTVPSSSAESTTPGTAATKLGDQTTTAPEDDAALATPSSSPADSAGQRWAVSAWLLQMASAIAAGVALTA